jgi:K+-sensing histidine kinase KdpD
MRFFQELTHDLRTPVASLKSLLETLAHKREALNPEIQSELTLLSLKEADYFERLIEDLLFLAQVTEPHYRSQKRELDIAAIIDEELDRLELLYHSTDSPISSERDYGTDLPEFKADPHLLRRLFRNALENAFSFAKAKVLVRIHWVNQCFEIHVEDDGPGLSAEALSGFGEKRVTRIINSDTKGRLSVGLGSVVMRTVATAHQGTVTITNLSEGRGADLKIVLNSQIAKNKNS